MDGEEEVDGGVKVSANGNGPEPTTESPRHAPDGLDNRSIDQRLSALTDTIQSWDWRIPAEGNGVGPQAYSKPDDVTADRFVEAPTGPVVAGGAQAPAESLEGQGLTPEEHPSPAADAAAAPGTMADTDRSGGLLVNPDTPAIADQPAPSVTGPVFIPEPVADKPEPVDPLPEAPIAPVEPVVLVTDETETRTGFWSRRSTKIVAIGLIVIAVVLAAILVLMNHNNNHANSGHSGATAVVTRPTTQSSSRQSATTTVAPSLTPAQLTQYDGYATALEKANGAASAGLVGLGSAPTVAQVTPLMASYLTAMKLYNLQIHIVPWPASMQTDVQADYAQLSAFLGFLQTFSAVTQPTLGGWLSQLHTVGVSAQTADNRVKQVLGVPASSSYP